MTVKQLSGYLPIHQPIVLAKRGELQHILNTETTEYIVKYEEGQVVFEGFIEDTPMRYSDMLVMQVTPLEDGRLGVTFTEAVK